ncbi:MAG: hypothetical protein ABSG62_08865 [Terracidiphilus sp.]|jgi:hypothetical protein
MHDEPHLLMDSLGLSELGIKPSEFGIYGGLIVFTAVAPSRSEPY